MLVISHRGNLRGALSSNENSPKSIDIAIGLGFDCEIDLWVSSKNSMLLGHDFGEFEISFNWLFERASKLWIHCKNLEALEFLTSSNTNFNFFWHQRDSYVLTSGKVIWSFPGETISARAIAVLPENWESKPSAEELMKAFGICTDYPLKFDHLINGRNH
mgnify:CR=1 FL=1